MRIAGPVLLFLLTLFWGATASADHMTGRYQGTGAIAGDVLDLRQSGTALQGTITGNDQGTLQGQTDGGNNAQGTIQLAQPGLAPISFQAVWSQQDRSICGDCVHRGDVVEKGGKRKSVGRQSDF